MEHLTIKFVGMKKTNANSEDDCSNEFDYFSGRQRIKKFRKGENKKKLFSLKIRLPKVRIPKLFKSSRKEETMKDIVFNNKRCLIKENIYVSLSKIDCNIHEEVEKTVKTNQSECARCIFGDCSFSCSCNFDTSSPDFKLYDGDVQFMYYNNAFFC